jgi:hypothetical protein
MVEIALTNTPPLAGFGAVPRREFTAINIARAGAALAAGHCDNSDLTTPAKMFKPSTGIRDPISARALVLSNGVRKVAIVKLDTIGMSRQLRDELVAAAQAPPLNIQPADLVVLATHTHSGPGGVSNRAFWQVVAVDCLADAVYPKVRDGAVQALKDANAALQPARLGVGTATVLNANKNRRGRPAVVDRELTVVKVITPTGGPIAALFNFAVHGTNLNENNMLLSADCMGEMEDRIISATYPSMAGAIPIFTNAAEGDVAPQHGGAAGLPIEGQIVGDAVMVLWPTIPTDSILELRGAFLDVDMPTPSWNVYASDPCPPLPGGGSATLCSKFGVSTAVPLPSSWVPTTLPFQALRIGNTVFVAIPGEPITEIGWDLKSRATSKGFTRGVILSLANDHAGYFTDAVQYQAADYEGKNTLYGPTTGQVVVDSADTVMTQVQ